VPCVYKRGSNPYFPVKLHIAAADSLGVRSLATFVEVGGVRIAIDPSAALGPRRYGLPPHQLEELALSLARKRIKEMLGEADVVVFTHYHWDHYDPELPLEGKTVVVKDPEKHINRSQRARAKLLRCPYIAGDGKSIDLGPEELVVSPPLPHGPEGTKLGYVIAVKVGEVLYSSDVQGPVSGAAAEWMIEQDPKTIVMDGPPTYFLGYRFSRENRDAALRNLERIMGSTGVKEIVLDHHLLRDLDCEERFPVKETAKEYGVRVLTAAEHGGREGLHLEAWRRMLWKGEKSIGAAQVRRAYHGGEG